MNEINIENIGFKYCPDCLDYSISHSNTVFHGISSHDLLNQDRIILPRGNGGGHDFYLRAFKNPKIHLGPLEIAGKSDLYLACNVPELLENYPDAEFLDHDAWCTITKRELEEGVPDCLFLDSYSEDIYTEILLGGLDSALAKYFMTTTEQAKKSAQEYLARHSLSIPMRDGSRLVEILNASLDCTAETCLVCH